MIYSENSKKLVMLNTWFFIINLLYLIFSVKSYFGLTPSRIPFYVVYLLLSVIQILVNKICRGWAKTVLVYTNVTVMLSYGIFNSVAQVYMPATIFLILFVMISVSFITGILQMLVITLVYGFVFLYSSYITKPHNIAYHDTYSFIVVMVFSLGVHYTYQRDKIRQFTVLLDNKKTQKALEVESSFDTLTSLFNRAKFFSLADEVLKDQSDDNSWLCILDLDEFKKINDNHGHQTGDKAIQITGETITDIFKLDFSEKWTSLEQVLKDRKSFAGRLGGDEFIILIRGEQDQIKVQKRFEEVLLKLNSINTNGLNGIRASVGITALRKNDKNMEFAYKRADDALYLSKNSGKNQLRFVLDA